MDVTYYVADALSGDIVPGLTLPLSNVSLTHRFTGGTFSATYRMNDGLDAVNQTGWQYFIDVLRALDPGTATLVPVADGSTTMGEWLIWRSVADDVTGDLELSGMEWHGYPKFRALEKDYVNSSIPAGDLIKTLLVDCFTIRQDMQITFANPAFGMDVGIDQRKKTAYYGDVIEDYAEQVPFEWYVNSQCQFVNGVPVKVNRNIEIVKDRFLRPQPTELNLPTPGSPGGQFAGFTRTTDYSSAAMSVYGFGKGEGEKQLVSDQYTTRLQDGRHVVTTKYTTHADITAQADLDRVTRAEALAASWPDEATRASILLDTTPSYPSLGDVFPVRVHPRPTLPGALVGTYRIGETTVRPDAGIAVMDVLMERIT